MILLFDTADEGDEADDVTGVLAGSWEVDVLACFLLPENLKLAEIVIGESGEHQRQLEALRQPAAFASVSVQNHRSPVVDVITVCL